MKLRAIGGKRRHHFAKRQAPRQPHRQRRHQIVGIVWSGKLCVGKAQDSFLAMNNPAVGKKEIATVRPGAERSDLRLGWGQSFRSVGGRDVLTAWIFE